MARRIVAGVDGSAPSMAPTGGSAMNVELLTAKHAMSRVLVAIRPEESPLMAWEMMRRGDVHHLPVVENGHVLGVLTREDVAASWSGGLEEQSRRQVRGLLDGRRRPRVRPDTSLPEVAAVMLDAGCDALPVVSEKGLTGLITARDVLAAVAGRVRAADRPGEVVTGMFHLDPILPAGD